MNTQRFRVPLKDHEIVASLRASAHSLTGDRSDYDPLLAMVGDSSIVLLGEASHGTQEFYRERARTQRLITELGFTAVAIEGDWPDAYRVKRYLVGESADRDAQEALAGFARFPTWMWRNAAVLEFIGWLRKFNDGLAASEAKIGFYGLDLYSLGASIDAVVSYLAERDSEAATHARARYRCLQPYAREAAGYGRAILLGVDEPSRRGVIAQLVELRRRSGEYLSRDGLTAEDEYFFAEQNAVVIANAEEYYRTMFASGPGSWNQRDRHMADTLDHLLAHLDRHGSRARVVVWAHNSHVGDARATEMGQRGELNIGQLTRERHGSDVVSVGFSTHSGWVTAASEWGAQAERKRVRSALAGSYERLLHETALPAFLICLRGDDACNRALWEPRLERAIGVIYRPETERQSHWFQASIGRQYDALVHIDATSAVEPLERTPVWELGEPPETYPSAL